jgi:hypothetical protein
MTKTKGKHPVDLNQQISVGGGGVHAYFDGVSLRLTFSDPFSDAMSHISLDAPTFEQLLRFAKDRVGGDFAALVAKVANET